MKGLGSHLHLVLYNFLKYKVFLVLRCEQGLCCVVPDAAPGDVGGGGGSRSELVITWEVSHQSYVLVCPSSWLQFIFFCLGVRCLIIFLQSKPRLCLVSEILGQLQSGAGVLVIHMFGSRDKHTSTMLNLRVIVIYEALICGKLLFS